MSKTLINGTAYDVKGGKCLVNGTGYSIKKGRTLINGTGYDINFGTPVSSLPVGTTIYLNYNGYYEPFIVIQQGYPTGSLDNSYSYSELDGCNGTWIVSLYLLYDSLKQNTGANLSLETSIANMDDKLSRFYNRFDTAAQNAMQLSEHHYDLYDSNWLYFCSSYVFLLSSAELNLPVETDYVNGQPCDYFKSSTLSKTKASVSSNYSITYNDNGNETSVIGNYQYFISDSYVYTHTNDGESEYGGGEEYTIYRYVNSNGEIEEILTEENTFLMFRPATILKSETEYTVQGGKYYIT